MGRARFDKHPRIILLLVLVSVLTSHGLQCWTCTNAKSNQHCKEIGRPRTCQTGQEMACATEVRRHRGFRNQHQFVTKRCKQSQACENQMQQNKSQCKKRRRDSVCRCCCRGDQCNVDNAGCHSQPTPSERGEGHRSRCRQTPQAPRNGEMECSYKKVLGEINSSCMFLCHEGYVLNGKESSTCLRRSSGSLPTFGPAPTCVRSEDALVTTRMKTAVQSQATSQPTTQTSTSEDICVVIPASPPLGGRSCINVDTGVVCTYFCPDGEDLIGSAVVTCTSDSGWSGAAPKCGQHCEDIGSGPANGVQNCIGSGRVGTYCDFSCDPGYMLIGNTRLRCVNDTGEATWNATIPFCRFDIPK